MSTHSWRTEIDLPKNQVWELLSEHYADIYKMHPGVRISNQVEGTPSLGLGQERVCHMYDGNRAQERITAHEEGNLLAIELVDSTLPMQKFSADFKLTEIAQGRTAVDMSVEVKGKGFLTLLSPLMARKTEQLITKVLRGLEAHGQTGRLVGQGGQFEEPAEAAA